MDQDCPFHYWTNNERYREWDEELPSFNDGPEVDEDQGPVNHPSRLHRLVVNHREDSSVFTAGRSFFACTESDNHTPAHTSAYSKLATKHIGMNSHRVQDSR